MEERPKCPVDEFGMQSMVCPELGRASGPVFRMIAHANRAACKLFSLMGQCVRLEIMDHLQLMFDVAKKHIGRDERVPFFP